MQQNRVTWTRTLVKQSLCVSCGVQMVTTLLEGQTMVH